MIIEGSFSESLEAQCLECVCQEHSYLPTRSDLSIVVIIGKTGLTVRRWSNLILLYCRAVNRQSVFQSTLFSLFLGLSLAHVVLSS